MVHAFETLEIKKEGAVDWLTLNRPSRLNAITGMMVHELCEYFAVLNCDYSRRVVVLRGAGRAFCAGLDLKARQENTEQGPPPEKSRSIPTLSTLVKLMRSCPQPIIALIRGAASGGGFALALASDVRIAGASARMNDAFIKLGLSGCELGLSFFLPRTVGLSVAAELMLTGRFIDAERAKAVGLVSHLVADEELDQAGRDLAAEMLRASPLGLRKTKETLNLALKLNELDAVMEIEEYTQLTCSRGDNFKEALAAFVEKREPRFSQ